MFFRVFRGGGDIRYWNPHKLGSSPEPRVIIVGLRKIVAIVANYEGLASFNFFVQALNLRLCVYNKRFGKYFHSPFS